MKNHLAVHVKEDCKKLLEFRLERHLPSSRLVALMLTTLRQQKNK